MEMFKTRRMIKIEHRIFLNSAFEFVLRDETIRKIFENVRKSNSKAI